MQIPARYLRCRREAVVIRSEAAAKHFLLPGAGFSRNRGGWLAGEVSNYLLTCASARHKSTVRAAIGCHVNSGIEAVLSELQEAYLRGGSTAAKRDVDDMQAAVLLMFQTMDDALQETAFELQNEIRFLVRAFLIRFDAIFTLNQDCLLERHYLNDNVRLGSPDRWQGWRIPGMIRVHDPVRQPFDPTPVLWKTDPKGFHVDPSCQSYVKLHGSSNWITSEGGYPTFASQREACIFWIYVDRTGCGASTCSASMSHVGCHTAAAVPTPRLRLA